MPDTTATFQAPLWRWCPEDGGTSGPAWWFVTVPTEHVPPHAGPWGRSPVCASVDGRGWNTSVWRDRRHGCVLAVPARLRRGRAEGDVVTVTLAGRIDT